MSGSAIRFGLLLLAASWAAPTAAADLSAELGLVSDYRYRGLSLTDGKPAAQATITVEHDSGAYGSIWTSTIGEPTFDAEIELDLTGGYGFEISNGLALDFSATYYVYPSEPDSNYVEATAELEHPLGPASVMAGFSFVPKQRGTRDDVGQKHRNSYLFVGASCELPKLPITLSAELGRERGFFDEVAGGDKWDWSLTGSIVIETFRLGLGYTGTDAGIDALVGSIFIDL